MIYIHTYIASYVVITISSYANKILSLSTGSDSLSTGAVVAITFIVTFIITLTAIAIVTFIVAYMICVKRKFESAFNHNNQSSQEKVLYEQVSPTSQAITKNDLELQQNPAYGTSHKVTMDTNPAYESCK